MKRLGLVGIKLGCTTYFDKLDGLAHSATVVKISQCVVSAIRNRETDGYNGLQIVFDREAVREKVISKPILGNLKRLSLPLLRYSKEFVFDETSCNIGEIKIGTQLDSNIFSGIEKVDVTGQVKGRGFTGAMKRWNFSGLEASHGVSVSHRSLGGTGQRMDPAKVFKNKKMAGRHGGFQKTIGGLRVLKNDVENNIMLIKGAIPGSVNGFVFIREVAKS